jgi:hypoxanthine phosphoribosyltransferase
LRKKKWRSNPYQFVRFAHPVEAEFAKVLTYYRVRWLYEPHQFPLDWHPDGTVARMFAPDFYLPEFDLYAELTTQKQNLVTRKNAKLRRLRELYPEINIRLFYRKDLQRLLARFGIAVSSQIVTPPGGLAL